MKNVLIVDDERLIKELFVRYIDNASDRYKLIDTISEADNAELICESKKVDLIIMDIYTANNSSGLEATAKIKRRFPNIKVIMVTSAPEYRFVEKAKQANADSFWYKDISKDTLLSVMDRTMSGESIFPEHTPSVQVGTAISDEFTKTELEILLHLSKGLSTPEIANRMNIATSTAKWHIKNLMEKTCCTTRTQLAILSSKAKLVMPEY